MKPAIRVDNLSKQYRIGKRPSLGSRNLTESLTEGARGLWRRLTGQQSPRDEDNSFWALKDVSFEVQPGEVVGIIGRNGAGKSTLLKILSRIVEPTSGRLEYRGRMASLLEVGTGFHPELTGRENIYMNGSLLGMNHREIDRNIDAIVAFSEIEQFLDTPVKRYSSGMYVRLAFAVAAHLEPDILVVDEVLAVGDAQFQKKCLGKMKDVGQQGRTILFVSHNMGAVNALCAKSIWLDKGGIVMAGDSATTVERYLMGMAGHERSSNFPVNLRDRVRPPHLEKRVKFLQVELQNLEGKTTYSFGVGEPVKIILAMESQVSNDYFIAGFSIRTSEGVVLYTSASDDSGKLTSIHPGLIQMSCVMSPNYLKPGVYYLQIGNEVGTTQDFLEEALSFEIHPTRHHSKTSLYALPGPLHFNYEWRVDSSVSNALLNPCTV